MRDLYKVSHFPVIEDIYGEEYYVKETRMDEKFDIELDFGRPVTSTVGGKKIIFTEKLKKCILETKDVPAKEFNGVLKIHTVMDCRRKLKANPYSSYQEWVESKDPNKPKEITIFHSKEKFEYIKDYFGIVYVLYSANITDDGLVCPMGIQKDIYLTHGKKTKRYILTSALAELIKKYRFYPHKGIHKFPFDMQTFITLKKELGYSDSANIGVNLWLAAHINKIMTMTSEAFTRDYASLVSISQNSVATVKTSYHHIIEYKKNRTRTNKEILKLLRQYEKSRNKELEEKLLMLLGASRFRDDFRAFHILMLAKELNHPIPRGLKSI